jgi:metal-responsive CopG/Arc/MetJ family transcriptional regulator
MAFKTSSISLPEELYALLDAEAESQSRDRSNMLRHILTERYRRTPRLENKLTGGELKK